MVVAKTLDPSQKHAAMMRMWDEFIIWIIRDRLRLQLSDPAVFKSGIDAPRRAWFVIARIACVDPQVVKVFAVEQVFDADDQLGVILHVREFAAQAQVGDGLRCYLDGIGVISIAVANVLCGEAGKIALLKLVSGIDESGPVR